ncbi:MAG: LD-carboxypeptidase [Desulfobacterales bacterium]|nr:LD-carboxypeptidase [Desulfobacterales bacterium]
MPHEKNIPVLPPRLRTGDTIGIVAPASPFDLEKFYRGIHVLKLMGFQVYVPDKIFKKEGYLAGSDAERADAVNRLFDDKKIKAIICARGGFGSLRILSLLDFEVIRKQPKIFAGFSDITAILSVLYTHCGFVTFHGPTVTTLIGGTQKTKQAMFSAFSSGSALNIKPEKGVTLRSGLTSGPVAGGNLTTLCHLLGTPFEPVLKGHILILEDKGEPSYKIDRMLSQMKIAGCFEGLAGLILGSFDDCGSMNEIFEIVNDIFKEYPIPILAGFEVGHGKNNVTFPIGLEATLDAGSHLLSFHKPPTIHVY